MPLGLSLGYAIAVAIWGWEISMFDVGIWIVTFLKWFTKLQHCPILAVYFELANIRWHLRWLILGKWMAFVSNTFYVSVQRLHCVYIYIYIYVWVCVFSPMIFFERSRATWLAPLSALASKEGSRQISLYGVWFTDHFMWIKIVGLGCVYVIKYVTYIYIYTYVTNNNLHSQTDTEFQSFSLVFTMNYHLS
jgi:hypothetical protein